MSKTSCIQLPPNDLFMVTRQCYLNLLSSDECAAKLLDFFVGFHDYKISEGWFDRAKPLLQDHTYGKLQERLLGTYGRNKIIAAVKMLVDAGFLIIHSNPSTRYKGDRTNHYEVVPSKIQKALNDAQTRMDSHSPKKDDGSPKRDDGSPKRDDLHKEPKILTKDTLLERFPNPERAHENSAGENFQLPEPEPNPTPPVKPTPKPTPPSKQSISGEGESSAACRTTETTSITITGYLAQTEKRFSPTLTRQEIAEITQALIDTYNKTKPDCWGTCTQITVFLTNQVTKLLEVYQQDLEIPEAIESLKNDVAAAHLSCKGDDFYDKPSFGIPSIAFFLDPKRIDKLRNRAQVWYDRSQQQKQQLAHKMVRDAIEGIPCWESGTILTGLRLSLAKTRYRDWHTIGDPQCPSIDYLQQYFPQILGAN